MYWTKTPEIIQRFFPNVLCRFPTMDKKLFLSFDDGPYPEITEWVLDILREYDAKASFFCVGRQVEKYPALFERIMSEGHLVANHSQNHLNGWKTPTQSYIQDVELAHVHFQNRLFRPPYGKLTPSQYFHLKKEYQIVGWDVLSGDFDRNVSKDSCFQNVIQNTRPGSIIVFHDAPHSFKKLKWLLPKILKFYAKDKWCFNTLTNS